MNNNIVRENVDDILWNAELRSELEPYFDESISEIDSCSWQLPLHEENEYLKDMLDWEHAPVLPVCRWFEPELHPQHPTRLSDKEISRILDDLIRRLYEKKIVLDFTDHLSDRELYKLICQNILPMWEKKLDNRQNFMHWDCSCVGGITDATIWLTYYAGDEEREEWAEYYHQPLPSKELPLYPRDLPQDPF
jgi:hypothetical protein